jgi:N6-adenosine-specific RNA methylase IME4
MTDALFAPLPTIDGGFACVHADVPSHFKSNSISRPGRNAMRHYGCHPMATFATLPVRDVVAANALLWFWTTGPLISIGAHIPVMHAWGFEPTAMGFVWIKLNPKASPSQFSERDLFFGPGLTTRKNAEFVIIGRRGRPKRLAKDVFEILVTPRRESGRKPDETYRRIERYCAGPRLDLFGRESRKGWTVWGDEAAKFDKAHPADSTPVISAARRAA